MIFNSFLNFLPLFGLFFFNTNSIEGNQKFVDIFSVRKYFKFISIDQFNKVKYKIFNFPINFFFF